MDFFTVGDKLLFYSTFLILGASLLLTVKTRFVQFRMLPKMFSLLGSLLFRKRKRKEGASTVGAHKALFTAMSTTIGISTIVSPVIAIKLGGPGAIIGFILATCFGAAVNYAEVTFALSYRKKLKGGGISGGPMQYLKDEIAPFLAKWYAFFTFLLMMVWSAAQSNQLASVLDSSLMGHFAIPTYVTGGILAVGVTALLVGGIKRVASFSSKIVPLMFVLYVGAGLWIVGMNFAKLPAIFSMVFETAFTAKALATGGVIGGIVSAFRWGFFKGLHTTEAGLGTQTIPHSMAETETPVDQGVLSMVSTLSAGFIWVLSALIALVTDVWLDTSHGLGISQMASAFGKYFSVAGIAVTAISAFLFAVGTILGNSFNGSQCFQFLTKRRYLLIYYLATAALVFVGSILDVKLIWSLVDFFVVPVVIPHSLALVYLAFKREHILVHPAPSLQATTS